MATSEDINLAIGTPCRSFSGRRLPDWGKRTSGCRLSSSSNTATDLSRAPSASRYW